MTQETASVVDRVRSADYEQLLAETRALSARLAVVNEVSQAITAAVDLDTILEVVVEQTKWVLDYDRCRIALRNSDGTGYRQWWLYRSEDAGAGTSGRTTSQPQSWPLDQGLAGWIITEAQILHLGRQRNLAHTPARSVFSRTDGDISPSVLGLPLNADGETIGALIFESRKHDVYNDADIHLSTILAAQIAVAVRNAQLLDESRRRTEHIEAMNAITRAITASLDIDEVFQTFAVQTGRLVEHDRMSISLLNDDGDTMRVLAVTTEGAATLEGGVELPVAGSAVGWVVTNRAPLIQPDIVQAPRFLEDEALAGLGIRSYLDVPLTVKGDAIGTLNVGCRRPEAFDENDVDTLTEIAGQVAIAIYNQRLYAETQRFAERLEQRVKERTRELEDVQAQLIEAERFAAAGRLAAAIAHEINNPMQSIRSGLELLARRLPNEDDVAHQYVDILLEEQNRVSNIIRQMLDFYRPPQEGREPTNVNQVIQQVVKLVEMDQHQTQVEMQLAPHLPPVSAHADQLKQVFLNVTLNAIEAMSHQGHLAITTEHSDDQVIIAFTDDGPGISAADRAHIFEPFYTTKSDGLGIGLSVSRSLIEAHGGEIVVRSEPDQGATFEIHLPIVQEVDDG